MQEEQNVWSKKGVRSESFPKNSSLKHPTKFANEFDFSFETPFPSLPLFPSGAPSLRGNPSEERVITFQVAPVSLETRKAQLERTMKTQTETKFDCFFLREAEDEGGKTGKWKISEMNEQRRMDPALILLGSRSVFLKWPKEKSGWNFRV